MTMQTDHHDHSLSNSVAGQMTLLTVALILVTLIAWFYVF